MEKIVLLVNILIVLMAAGTTVLVWKLWKITKQHGLYWLVLSLAYATILRMSMVVYGENVTKYTSCLMVVFWAGLIFSVYKLYKQTETLLTLDKYK